MLFAALIWSHFLPVGQYSHFLYLPWCLRKLPGGFPDNSVGKESTCNAGDSGSSPGLGRSAGEGIGYPLQYSWASLVAQLVKNPSAIWETWVRSLSWENPLEKGTATHSSILSWRIPWTTIHRIAKSRTQLSDFHFHSYISTHLICTITCLIGIFTL